MVSLRKVGDYPQVISTNRHIMQGMMECHGIKWDARNRTLSGNVDVVGGETFVLTLACNGWSVLACDCARVKNLTGDIASLCFDAKTNQTKTFRIRFGQKMRKVTR